MPILDFKDQSPDFALASILNNVRCAFTTCIDIIMASKLKQFDKRLINEPGPNQHAA